jgi:hypothetical protein
MHDQVMFPTTPAMMMHLCRCTRWAALVMCMEAWGSKVLWWPTYSGCAFSSSWCSSALQRILQVDREIEERARGLGAGHDDRLDSTDDVRDADAQRVKEEVAPRSLS